MLEAFLLTILVGIFFLIGLIIPYLFSNKEKLILISTGFTFIIMLFLIIFDLVPEIIEIFSPLNNFSNLILIIIFFILGISSLKLLDIFIPEHKHNHHDNETNLKEHNDHFFHIGLITALSLTIHNILEGISIYISGLNSLESGFILALTVGLHNLPLGIEISASMGASTKKKISKVLISCLLIFSSSLGALFLYLLQTDFNTYLEGILLSLTLGMIIYISLFELFHEVKENIRKKEMKSGLLLGIIIGLIMFLL